MRVPAWSLVVGLLAACAPSATEAPESPVAVAKPAVWEPVDAQFMGCEGG